MHFSCNPRSSNCGVDELLHVSLAVVKSRLDWANRQLQAEPGAEAATHLIRLVRECVLTLSAIQTSIATK
jgi:hypothetical protein